MLRKFGVVLSVVVLVFFLVSCKSTESTVEEATKVQLLDAKDMYKVFPSVVRISSRYTNKSDTKNIMIANCTAEVVSDNVLLTAGHCFPKISDFDMGPIYFNNYASYTFFASNEYLTKKVEIPGNVESVYDYSASDIAVVVFNSNIFKKYKKMRIASGFDLKDGTKFKAVGVEGVQVDQYGTYMDNNKIIVDFVYKKDNFEGPLILKGIGETMIGASLLMVGKTPYPKGGYSGGPLVLNSDQDTIVGVLSQSVEVDAKAGKYLALFPLLGSPENERFFKTLVEKEGICLKGINDTSKECKGHLTE